MRQICRMDIWLLLTSVSFVLFNNEVVMIDIFTDKIETQYQPLVVYNVALKYLGDDKDTIKIMQ